MSWLIPTGGYVLCVGSIGVTSKLALETLSWPDLVLWSGICYVPVVAALVHGGHARLRLGPGGGWAIAAAAAAIGGLVAAYIALGEGDASQVVPVAASYPAVTLLLSALLLGERLSPGRVLGVALVICGVVVITID